MTPLSTLAPRVKAGLSIAVVDGDIGFTKPLARYLRGAGARVEVFASSADLLAHQDPYGRGFYVVDLALPAIGGAELTRLLRRRSTAGVLMVAGSLAPEPFRDAITAGADMVLAKPLTAEQVALAIEAVQRRIETAAASPTVWRLDPRARQLIAPDGARVDLSPADLSLMEGFLQAQGEVVERAALRERLGHPPCDDKSDGLNAVIYRLRRRIERATPALVPLQARSRVGYVFKAPLLLA